jgi:urease accessory protein
LKTNRLLPAGQGEKETVLKPTTKFAAGLLMAAAPSLALAHAGHAGDGLHGAFYEGFMHPFTGLDHLLMMAFVGAWAARAGTGLRWQLPALFLAGLLGGWALGAAGFVPAGLESGVAATLIALGAAMALRLRLPRLAQFGGVALFAALHGLAHGGELRGSGAAWAGALGMLAASALLQLAGWSGPTLARRLAAPRADGAWRVAGGALAIAGGALLAAA